MSDRTDGTGAAAVGAHSKDAVEARHGGNLSNQGTPGTGEPDRSPSGTSDEAGDLVPYLDKPRVSQRLRRARSAGG